VQTILIHSPISGARIRRFPSVPPTACPVMRNSNIQTINNMYLDSRYDSKHHKNPIMKNALKYIVILSGLLYLSGCELDIIPSDALTGDQIQNTSDGLISLVNGCYAQFKDFPDPNSSNNWYLRQYYHLSDFAGDDIACGYKTEDDLINSFRYNDRTSEMNVNSFGSK
jgi:hypothetical protein